MSKKEVSYFSLSGALPADAADEKGIQGDQPRGNERSPAKCCSAFSTSLIFEGEAAV